MSRIKSERKEISLWISFYPMKIQYKKEIEDEIDNELLGIKAKTAELITAVLIRRNDNEGHTNSYQYIIGLEFGSEKREMILGKINEMVNALAVEKKEIAKINYDGIRIS